MTTKIAADSGQFDAMAVMPSVVLGPCMATVHELRGSWQWAMARMLEGKPCPRGHVRQPAQHSISDSDVSEKIFVMRTGPRLEYR